MLQSATKEFVHCKMASKLLIRRLAQNSGGIPTHQSAHLSENRCQIAQADPTKVRQNTSSMSLAPRRASDRPVYLWQPSMFGCPLAHLQFSFCSAVCLTRT